MGEPFGLLVHFRLKDGAGAAFDQLVSDTIDQIRAHEPGTLVYVSHYVQGQPESRVFYELYRDRAAFDDHEAQPHTRRFLEQRDLHLVSYEVMFLSLAAAKGVTHTEPTP